MKSLKVFFKQRETFIGIGVAVVFQLVFVIVWLTGYNGVYDRTNNFTVGVVNEDFMIGEKIVDQLMGQHHFQLALYEELPKAMGDLDAREIHMLIHLSENLTEQIETNEDAKIDYYINQSVPTFTKQMMETIAEQLNEQVNLQVSEAIESQLAASIPLMINGEFENGEMVEDVVSQIMVLMRENSNLTPIQADVIKTNDKKGFSLTMIPLLEILASYIGAMLISQHLQFSEAKLRGKHSKLSLFLGRQIINILAAVVISLLTVGLMYSFQIEFTRNFFVLWGFQAMLMFSFLGLSQIFVMLFGNPGMAFNVVLTATQLVSSGAIVPRELLSSFYHELGSLLPATYGVNGYFSLIYGGGDLSSDMTYLGITITVLMIIAVVVQLAPYLWEKMQFQKQTVVKS